jgi:hypothetical protein
MPGRGASRPYDYGMMRAIGLITKPSHYLFTMAAKFLVIGAVAIVVLVAAGAGGYYYYQSSLQPNVHVTNTNIGQPSQTPASATVVSDGRVSGSGSFNYAATLDGSYVLTFDNSFSTFSSKTVDVTYTAGSAQSTTTTLNVPAGQAQVISVQLTAGQNISGSFSVSGGSGNDVDFDITANTCSETIPFSYDLANTGSVSGNVTSSFQSDGQQIWSHNDLVSPGQQVPVSGTAQLANCATHNFTIAITSQQRA